MCRRGSSFLGKCPTLFCPECPKFETHQHAHFSLKPMESDVDLGLSGASGVLSYHLLYT